MNRHIENFILAKIKCVSKGRVFSMALHVLVFGSGS